MNHNVCIDASLALAWLLPDERNSWIDALFNEWDKKGISLISAPLFHAEVTSALRKQVYFKKLTFEQGEHIFSSYLKMGVESINDQAIYTLAWELAKQFNLPKTYDTQYLAVAELNDCELWTSDKRLVNSLQDKSPRIKLADAHSPGR